REPQLMKGILQIWRADGVPKDVPLMVTEIHRSWQLPGPRTTIFAALWLADNVGSFFEGGGAAFYHSPIQPQGVNNTCLGWSSWSNFVSNENYEIRGYTSPYYAARLINLEWVQHRSGVHQMFPSATNTHHNPKLPPSAAIIDTDSQTTFTLPKASITVIRGRVRN